MADTAAYLCDSVLPEAPYRQWVFTVPFRIRYPIAFDRELCAQVKRIFIRAVMSLVRRKARRSGLGPTHCGAVVFVQRFGGSLNLNPHFHALLADGVFVRDAETGSVVFHPLDTPTTEEVRSLTARLRARVLRLFSQKGLLPEDGDESDDQALLPFDSADLGGCYAASIEGRVYFDKRRGTFVQRVGRVVRGGRRIEFSGERCAEMEGFTLHAGERVDGRKRKRLERLLRYMARPSVAESRLKLLADGRVLYRLKTMYSDGTKALVFAPLVFIEKLCALIPPPRQNLVSYFGVFAPNAAMRPEVVPPPGGDGRHLRRPRSSRGAAGDQKRRKKYSWAELMKRVFEVDVLVCPYCGGRRKLISQITRASAIRAFLTSVGLPTGPPVLRPALWPP